MSNVQKMLYDSDAGAANTAARRRYSVRPGIPVKITAAGLAPGECAPVYVYVGSVIGFTDCTTCIVDEPDFKWTPLVRCGVPVALCGDSNEYVEKLPGLYSVGDPSVALSFAGDVNISSLELTKEYLEVPFCAPQSGDPAPVEVISSCAEPIYVEICNPSTTLVETALAELGCAYDVDGSLLGKVIIQRIDDEDAGTHSYEQTLFKTDGTIVTPYSGPWTTCGCTSSDPSGVLLDWG